MSEEELAIILKENSCIMRILTIIKELNLNDCWLCAGTLRNFVWNYLNNQSSNELISDIDVVFYDPEISYEDTLAIEKHLKESYSDYDWELKNQVYMHIHNPQSKPYLSSRDAISKFPETCTSIGARLKEDSLELYLPHGIEDLVTFKIKPTPFFKMNEARMNLYKKRVSQKNWQENWSNLTISY